MARSGISAVLPSIFSRNQQNFKETHRRVMSQIVFAVVLIGTLSAGFPVPESPEGNPSITDIQPPGFSIQESPEVNTPITEDQPSKNNAVPEISGMTNNLMGASEMQPNMLTNVPMEVETPSQPAEDEIMKALLQQQGTPVSTSQGDTVQSMVQPSNVPPQSGQELPTTSEIVKPVKESPEQEGDEPAAQGPCEKHTVICLPEDNCDMDTFELCKTDGTTTPAIVSNTPVATSTTDLKNT